jgi:hypothetical protein
MKDFKQFLAESSPWEEEWWEITFNDKRHPGGSPQEVMRDYDLFSVEMDPDGDITVMGPSTSVIDYMTDYAIYVPEEEIHVLTPEEIRDLRGQRMARKFGM